MMIGQLICPRPVGEALSLPQLTQWSGSVDGVMYVGVAKQATRAASSRPYDLSGDSVPWESAIIVHSP